LAVSEKFVRKGVIKKVGSLKSFGYMGYRGNIGVDKK